jgi:hypothetical protein
MEKGDCRQTAPFCRVAPYQLQSQCVGTDGNPGALHLRGFSLSLAISSAPSHVFPPLALKRARPLFSLSTRSLNMDRLLYFPASANDHHFNRNLEARCCCVGY